MREVRKKWSKDRKKFSQSRNIYNILKVPNPFVGKASVPPKDFYNITNFRTFPFNKDKNPANPRNKKFLPTTLATSILENLKNVRSQGLQKKLTSLTLKFR